MPAKWSFSPRWNHSGTDLNSWITWLPAARPNGSSTPSGLSPAPSKSWTTLAGYPPGGHFQSPALGHHGGQGLLPPQGLSPRGPAEDDDTGRRRVYPPLPVARAARRLPAHPLLRLPGQPIPGTEISTLPRTLGHANARTTSLGNRQGLSRALRRTHRLFVVAVPGLSPRPNAGDPDLAATSTQASVD